MKKTVLSHFYNEEYLLPWWLKHHREIFDHGVMINYASTDSSVEIIKELCPTWEIVESINKDFDALTIESEIQPYERAHEGWKLILNTTEFFIGNTSLLENEKSPDTFTVRCHIMVDSIENENKEPDPNLSLLSTRTNGINTFEPHGIQFKGVRNCRMMHKLDAVKYRVGRHYGTETTDDMHVLWYGFSPFTEKLLDRKLQIKTRIPEHNVKKGLGVEHMYTKERMVDEMKKFQSFSKDMSAFISKYGRF